jgi:SecD/SecF fusion protein
MKTGKTLVASIEAAFEKAFSAIFDANITTLMTAVILFYLATGLIKGFAITLTVGIVGTLLGALIVTRVMFQWFTDANILKTIKVTQIIPDRKFNILNYARPVIIGSFALAALSVVGFAVKGKDAVGIDFRGGSLSRFEVSGERIAASEVETVLKDAGVNGAYVQETTTATGEMITIRSEYEDSSKVSDAMAQKYGDKVSSGQTDRVGSVIGKELATKSALAFGLAIVCIFIYLIIFYELSFAVGAIIALIHDCMITLGVVMLMGQQLSVIHIGALLTVAGYSINDTIVVFDRIREIIRSRSGSIIDIMNEAISMTLSRTLLTGVTTLGPMSALYFFGGPAMKEFSMPIIVGVLVGTYSSIYVAAPIVLWFAKLTGTSLKRQVRDNTDPDIKPPAVAV